MALDSVPWFVGGGAQHSPEIARLLAYAAFNGNEGVLAAGDLKVTQLDVPGAGAKVAAGVGVMLNRASGGGQQAYVARNPAADSDSVTFAATGSGETRSDLVVLRVEDPFLAGEPWDDPTDVTVGPYVFLRVISGVSSTATTMPAGMTGIPLARVDFPASTATVTNSMITDLRKLANPRRERYMKIANPTASTSNPQKLTATSFTNWPSEASWSIDIPPWATKAIVRAILAGVVIPQASGAAGFVHGDLRVLIGSTASQSVAYDETIPNGAVVDRMAWVVSDSVTLPSSIRGTTQTVRLQADKGTDAAVNTSAGVDLNSSISLDIEFLEAAE